MHNRSLRFRTERFEYQAELPEDANAGNRFYGADVAEFLAQGLSDGGLGMDYLDEDWGWSVFGKTDDGLFLEIAIYQLSEDGTPGESGTNEWGLWLRAHEKTKWLGLFTRTREVEVPPAFADRLRALLAGAGIEARPWKTPG